MSARTGPIRAAGQIAAVACAFAGLLLAGGAQATPADELKALMDAGRAAEAYALGQKHPEEMGKPEFDFRYGVAAVDSGNAGQGVLALERYLLNNPGSDLARLELARGYFALGDMVRARELFEEVTAKQPPAAVQATIDRYLDAIRARESRYQPSALAWAEIGVGFDSNVNSGVGSANINLPTFGAVTVNAAGVRSGDNFTHLAAGAQFTRPLAPGLALFGGAQGDGKLNWNREDALFSQKNWSGNGGLSYIKNDNLFRATLGYATAEIQDDRFRNAGTVAGEWHHQIDELQSFNSFVQYGDLRYLGANEIRNADLWVAGAGYRRAFIARWQPVLSINATVGRESNRKQRPDLSRDMLGLRLGVSMTPAARWGVSAGVSWQGSDYVSVDPTLLLARADRYLAADATVSYAITRALSLRAEVQLTDNASNIALYKYDRTFAVLKLRYDFK